MKAISTILAAVSAAAALTAHAEPGGADLKRGRYLLQIGGCNDCHTAGYATSGGKVPDAKWVTGDAVGWQGPWGTTYPVNLRLYMQGLSEEQWVNKAKGMVTRPPMPWFALRDMTDDDLAAIYHYIRSLGPAGQPAPAAAASGTAVATPYIEFVPKNLPKHASR